MSIERLEGKIWSFEVSGWGFKRSSVVFSLCGFGEVGFVYLVGCLVLCSFFIIIINMNIFYLGIIVFLYIYTLVSIII